MNEGRQSFASPTSVISSLPHNVERDKSDVDDDFKLTPSSYHINLDQFIQLIPDTIRNSNANNIETSHHFDDCDEKRSDSIASLFR